MSVRAKFRLQSIKENAGYSARTLEFYPQYDTSIPGDQRFAKTTPSGKFEMTVDNPVALEQLKLGEDYYFDITPAPKP